jgi:glycosyltransferase involved in cell wall biosynthesis
MKILFVDTYYPKFLESFKKNNPGILNLPYKSYKQRLFATFFGTSDFYSYNLKRLGYLTDDMVVNDEILQKKWAKENGFRVNDNWVISRLQSLPYVYRFLGKPQWVQQIALKQIKKYKPDVVYMQDLNVLNLETLREAKNYCKLLVGQIASPPPPIQNLKCFDLIITSFPHYVQKFRKMGIKSEYQKLAFEPRILKKIGKQKRIYDVTFVGSFTPYHSEGTKVLEEVALYTPVHVWGQGVEFLSPLSPLRKNYHGEAWGLDMYKILAQSKIVINRHISVSGEYANNMRLYEATGVGTTLITDHKRNLNDLFKLGKEVVEYKNSKDLIDKINYYLKNEAEREKIAKAGQRRTLRDHNYNIRMRKLVKILKKYI